MKLYLLLGVLSMAAAISIACIVGGDEATQSAEPTDSPEATPLDTDEAGLQPTQPGLLDKLTSLVDQVVGEPPEVTARFLPADTQVYFTINLEPGAGQKARARSISSLFEGARDYESERDQLVENIQDVTDIDVVDELYDWIGSDLTFALLNIAMEPSPDWVLMVQTKDRTASESFFDEVVRFLEDQAILEFEKAPLLRDDIVYIELDEEISFGLTDDYALIANSSTVVKNMARNLLLPPLDPLSGDEAFQKAAARLPAERFMLGFVRGQFIYKEILREHHSRGDYASPRRYIPEVSGMSGAFLDGGIRVDLYTDTPPGVTVEANKNPLTTADLIPQDALAFASGTGLEEGWLQFRDTLEYVSRGDAFGFDDGLFDFEFETGIDVEVDIIRQIDGEIAAVLLPSSFRLDGFPEFISGAIELVGIAEVGDPTGTRFALEELVDRLEEDGDVRVRSRSVGSYDAVVLDLSNEDPEWRGFSPGYLFTDELVVVGSTVDALVLIIDTLNGEVPPLSSSPEFSELAGLAPENASYVVFADIAGIIDSVINSLPPDTRNDNEDKVRPFLEPFDSFFAAATSNEEFTIVTAVLTFKTIP